MDDVDGVGFVEMDVDEKTMRMTKKMTRSHCVDDVDVVGFVEMDGRQQLVVHNKMDGRHLNVVQAAN